MVAALDPRLIIVGIEVNGAIKTYNQSLMISAKGTKFGNGIFNECQLTLYNLTKDTQDYILTQTSPYNTNRTPKLVTLDAGRASYGTSRIFTGNIFTAKPTQPPDIGIILRCLENGFNGGNIVSRNQSQTMLSTISEGIAKDNGLTLVFEATDKVISNYNFNGPINGQISALSSSGNVDVYQDGLKLIVKNKNVSLIGPTRIINTNNGMIGIPEFTELGIRVTFLLDNVTTVGTQIQIQSNIYPAVNGNYVIFKLDFDIASRTPPFYYTAEATRIL